MIRWFVLASLFYSIYKASRGYFLKLPFTKSDHVIRHSTATIAHLQLVAGMFLYMGSPLVKYFWKSQASGMQQKEVSFFGIIHISMMFVAIIIITIGSALAKRKESSEDKFKTMLLFFSIALLIILVAIPWPFSPIANRPYIRGF